MITRFDYESFNRSTIDAGWSAGAITEHLLLTDLDVLNTFAGKRIKTDRDGQDEIAAVQSYFEIGSPHDTPSHLIPSDVPKDPGAFTDRILETRRKLIAHIIEVNMNLVYPDAPHPVFGVLSGIEWINYIYYHTDWHFDEMEKLLFDNE